MWFIGVEVEQETTAPLLKNPGSARAVTGGSGANGLKGLCVSSIVRKRQQREEEYSCQS